MLAHANMLGSTFGAVHKVRHARGGRGSEEVWQFVTGVRGFKSMWRHAYTNLYRTYETWNFKRCLTFCCNRCILTEGGTDKKTLRTKPSRQKTLWQKCVLISFIYRKSDKNLCEQLRANSFRGLVRVFCSRPTTKSGGGSEMCDILLGGPGCATKCDRGIKIGQK